MEIDQVEELGVNQWTIQVGMQLIIPVQPIQTQWSNMISYTNDTHSKWETMKNCHVDAPPFLRSLRSA